MLENMSETFGKPCSLLWLLPTKVKFHGLTWEQIFLEVVEAESFGYGECPRCV